MREHNRAEECKRPVTRFLIVLFVLLTSVIRLFFSPECVARLLYKKTIGKNGTVMFIMFMAHTNQLGAESIEVHSTLARTKTAHH